MKDITIDLDVYNYLVSKGLGSGESASSILRRELTRTIAVDDDLYDYVLSLATNIGESASSILRRSLQMTPSPPPAPPGGLIEFRIKAGTHGGAWNTRPEMVVGVVGQTLRIFNDDDVMHRPHTSGQPFAHAATEIAPGTSMDFPLTDAMDPSAAAMAPVYDHLYGPAAQFWIKVTLA